jgi:hypothetical protein
VFCLAVCGSSADNIFIRDLGNGSCVSSISLNGGAFAFGNCTSQVYNQACGSFLGSLTVYIGNDLSRTPGAYVQPNITMWLTNMGLNDVNVIKVSLNVFVDANPALVPIRIAPVFLTKVQQVATLYVSECANCDASKEVPPARSVLTGLPGLKALQQILQVPQENSFVTISNTAFPDMSSLSALTCPPAFVSLTGNKNMTSLAGLEKLQPYPGDGAYFNASGSGPFTNVSSSAIKTFAGCAGSTTSEIATFLLPVSPCGPPGLISYSEYCVFLVNGICPTARPPPYAPIFLTC